MKKYSQKVYQKLNQKTAYTANAVLSLVLDMIPVSSAVDVGCGVGTWLSFLRKKNISDIQGIDGDWVDYSLLEIPEQNFLAANISKPIELNRKYDLAISLEVGEHLAPNSAEDFVDSLTNLSDFILFSAAIPFQGGENHINEQWPDYWAKLFHVKGFTACDCIRKTIWNDSKIPVWYRQNILFFVKNDRVSEVQLTFDGVDHNSWPLSIVHPEMYQMKQGQYDSVRQSSKQFWRMSKNWLMRRVFRIRRN